MRASRQLIVAVATLLAVASTGAQAQAQAGEWVSYRDAYRAMVLGRTVFPLTKAAYDENAALVLNRKGMPFVLRPQVTVAPRADGQYDAADLRTACAQALGFVRYVDASQRGRQCAGVRFVFPKKETAGARLRHPDGGEQALPIASGAAFTGDPDEGFPVVTWRFSTAPGRAQVVTYNAPLAIVPIFE